MLENRLRIGARCTHRFVKGLLQSAISGMGLFVPYRNFCCETRTLITPPVNPTFTTFPYEVSPCEFSPTLCF